tara:strand:- start:2585 stop:3445 length:861 start_codon:yes stop_codon:yes gene_type:complete
MSSRPPPIPRGSAAGRVKARPPPIPIKTADNVVRAREQLKRGKAIAENRARIPVARSRQVLSQGETDRVERLFQSRNELDAFKAVEERNNERRRNAEFQERRRQTGLTSKQLAIARKVGRERSQEIKNLTPFVNRKPLTLKTREEFQFRKEVNKALGSSDFSKELNREAVAGRVFGGSDRVDFANALFGGAGLDQVIQDRIKHTEVKPRIPEPEPEPEPEFISPPPPPQAPLGTEARARPQPIGARDNRPMSERSTANFEANAFQPNTAGGGQRLADSVIQSGGTF